MTHIYNLTLQKPWSNKAAYETFYHRNHKQDTRGTVAIHTGDWRKSSNTTFRTKDSKHPTVETFMRNIWAYHEVISALVIFTQMIIIIKYHRGRTS